MSSKQLQSTLSKSATAARLAALAQALFLRLFICHLKRFLSTHLQRWHVAAAVLSHVQVPSSARTAVRRTGDLTRTNATAKSKIHPPKVEIKSVRTLMEPKSEVTTSPSVSTKRISLSATLKLAARTSKVSKPPEKSNSCMTEEKAMEIEKKRADMMLYKRPTSVPPVHEDLRGTKLLISSNYASDDDKPHLSGTLKSPRGKSAQRNTPDVCTRLFNQAQERETKREEMRKSLEPGYTFTPRLAQGTNKWLSQKTAKSTPMKSRGKTEEVAVVSSAAVLSSLGRIGEVMAPKGKENLKLAASHPDKMFRVPVIPLVPQDTLVEEEELPSEGRWGKKCSPFSLLYTPEELAGQYASFGVRINNETAERTSISPFHKAGMSINSPCFSRKESIDDQSGVFIDFTGEESCDSFIGDKTDLPA